MHEAEVRDFFFGSIQSYGFIHAGKEVTVEGLQFDVFCIDRAHVPYIVEFKSVKDRHVVGQSAQYLALAPAYTEEISKRISFYDIRWDRLQVIIVAPAYHHRDLIAARCEPLSGRTHLYTYDPILNSRKQIFGLTLRYVGPSEAGPIVLSEETSDGSDLFSLMKQMKSLAVGSEHRGYYTNHIKPLLDGICSECSGFYRDIPLFGHASLWDRTDSSISIRIGTDRKQTHRASICFIISDGYASYGFDLTHSLGEAKVLEAHLSEPENRELFCQSLAKLQEYYLWIPGTGFRFAMPIEDLERTAMSLVLSRYHPQAMKECYFHIQKKYNGEKLTPERIVEVLHGEYTKFEFIFEILRGFSSV